MIQQRMEDLRCKLDDQILKNNKYNDICRTSEELDLLIVEYYKIYGLRGAK